MECVALYSMNVPGEQSHGVWKVIHHTATIDMCLTDIFIKQERAINDFDFENEAGKRAGLD